MEINMLKRLLSILALLAFALSVSSTAWADDYASAINRFKKAGESASFFKKSVGYAVFPTVGKGGVGVGGAYGKGRLYHNGKHVGDTSMTQLSVGFQLGGEAFSEIIFFETEDALKKFTSGNFEFGAEAQAVAITAAAGAKASTTGSSAAASATQNKATTAGVYHDGMATFTVMKGGLMYEASLSGQKFSYKAL
jgi:lipid-binding SYLF domain-containing protein